MIQSIKNNLKANICIFIKTINFMIAISITTNVSIIIGIKITTIVINHNIEKVPEQIVKQIKQQKPWYYGKIVTRLNF